MATLVIKSFPDDLHERLKETAAKHRRSVTQETIHLLESILSGNSPKVAEPSGPSYWASRKLIPEFEEALQSGAFDLDSESTELISEERDAR